MKHYSLNEAETRFEEIVELLENHIEEEIVVTGEDRKPICITLFNNHQRDAFIGCAKGMFEIPEDFDDIDIAKDFEEKMLS